MFPCRKAWLFSLILALIGLVAALSPIGYRLEESIGLHLLFHLRGTVAPPAQVAVVALDRRSSKALNLPMEPRNWPRTVHARLIERLQSAGAAVIVFDLIFNEVQTEETDGALAHAIRRAGNVILAQSIVDETIRSAGTQGRASAVVRIEKMIPPIEPLAEAALAQAPFPVPRVPVRLSRYWTFKPGSGDVPTMPVVAFCAFARESFERLLHLVAQPPSGAQPAGSVPALDGGRNALVEAIRSVRERFLGDHQLADEVRRELTRNDAGPRAVTFSHTLANLIWLYQSESDHYLNFYGPAGTISTIPYHRAFEGTDAQGRPLDLRGKTVFVGQTESYWPKAKDGFFTVYAREEAVDISGVEIAATAFANLLEGRRVAPLAVPLQMAVIFAWTVAMALISYRLPAIGAAALGAGLCGAYLIGAVAGFQAAGTWLPIVVPLFLVWPAAFFSSLIWKYHTVSRERRTIRRAFGYYLPTPVVDQLARNIEAIHAERQMVYSICLFTDAEKYTNLSESMDPEWLTAFMNRYYEAIFKPIRDCDGLVLQVVGDSALSIWTAAQPDAVLKAKACRAALGVAAAVERFNREDHGATLPTRLGLHAGDVVLGNIGAMDHFEYRPVGDIVNTASRLEGLNKYLGTRILISEAVVDDAAPVLTRFVGRFVFAGKTLPVSVYELVERAALDDSRRQTAWRLFGEGLRAFQQQDWERAAAGFTAADQGGGDGPSAFYLRLCHRYRQTPPGVDWDGTVHLLRK